MGKISEESVRCAWVSDETLYLDYHDQEWGVPVTDDRELFEMLILEGAQAGLSWITILRKRENYRAAFKKFDPYAIIELTDHDVERLMSDEGIIRNRLKIKSVISNANAWVEIMKAGEGAFCDLIWSVVAGKTIINRWNDLNETPTSTAESEELSKLLKKKGFKFVGPTICYAYMQACGMVNDHVTGCFRHEEISPRA
ncbi:DNA-3-methyladenine glycosylase I [Kiloniella antarctica]|uniref:DNA-3-methyladenine glycosylase I n=1 Tax=Kiloniella antarctica TaxID=1550907 RepID=A0ABW5BJQ4_9PROT